MQLAKLATTDEIRRLNRRAGVGALSEMGIADLAPDAMHVGIALGVSNDGREVLIAWLLEMLGRQGRFIVHVTAPWDEVVKLRNSEVDDEVVARVSFEARRWMLDQVARAMTPDEVVRWVENRSSLTDDRET